MSSKTEIKKSEKNQDRKKKRNKIINILEWMLLGISIAVFVYTFSNTARGKAVTFFGKSLLYVVTGSMEPTIHVGEYVIVDKTDVSKLGKGDIIAFYTEIEEIKGSIVIHRIIEKNADGTFTVMGDANPVPDDIPVKPEKIVGKYVRKSAVFNFLASFTNPRKLLFLMVVIPIFLISVYEAVTVVNIVKKGVKDAKNEVLSENSDTEVPETYEEKVARIKEEAIREYLDKQNGEGKEGKEE